MVRSIDSSTSKDAHAEFQSWRASNPRAPFLVVKTKKKAYLHFVDACWHCGNSSWDDPLAKGLANTEKIISDSEEEILKYAADRRLTVSRCMHCDKKK